MARVAPLISVALLVASCAPPPTLSWLSSDGIRSGILLTLEPGQPPVAEALELENVFQRRFQAGDPGRVLLLAYRVPLAEKSLEPGPLTLVRTGAELPAADLRYQLELGSAWSPLETLPSEVSALRVQDRCLSFAIQTFRLPEVGPGATFLVPVDADRLLLGLDSGSSYLLGPAGPTRFTGLSTSTVFRGAHRDAAGELWLLGTHGELLHGHPDRGFVAGPSMPNPGSGVVGMDGSRGDAPFELFAITASHALSRFADGAWRSIPGPTGPRAELSDSEVAWLGPGNAAVIGHSNEGVIEAASGQELQLHLPQRPDLDGTWGLRWVDGLGPMIGSRWSSLYLRGPQDWALLPLPPNTNKSSVLVPMPGGGLMFGGGLGLYAQYHPGFGYCPARPYSTEDPRYYAQHGGAIVLVAQPNGGVVITRLTPLP